MKKIFIKTFGGYTVCTFLWNGRPCWIATQIVEMLGYAKPSKTISQCILAEEFEIGKEYDVLSGDMLKEFKKLATDTVVSSLKHIARLIIFYEDGLYGFLQYTEKPEGIEFRKWLRREVIPEIREKGTYTLDDKISSKTYSSDVDNLKDKSKDNLAMSLERELIHSDDNIDDALDQFYNNGLSYNDFSDVRRKGSYERADVELKFSSSIKRVKVGRDGFDLDKLERIKFATESAKMFKELLDRSGVSDSDKFLFLKAIYEEAGMELPFVDL